MAPRKRQVNQGLYKVLADLMDDDVFVVDRDEKITYANNCGVRHLGLTPGDVVGRTIKELFPPDTYLRLSSNLRHVVQSGGSGTFEDLFTFCGKEVWIETRLVPIKDGGGEVTAVLALSRDVTDRLGREEAIIRAKREWEQAMDSITDPIAVIGSDHRVRRVNRAMAEKMGLTPQRAVGVLCHESVHNTTAPPPFCPLLRLIGDGKEHLTEIRDGGALDGCLVKVSPLRDPGGSVIGCVHVARPLASVERQDEPDQGIRKRLFAVLKSVEHLTTIQDTEGRYLFVTSVPPADSLADVIGKSPSDILDSYNAAVVMEQVQQVALRGDSRNRLTRITLGEETLNFLSQVSPVRDSSGNVTAVATVSRKIDDHAWTKGDFAALTSPALPSLTKRELQVLKLIASGLTSRQIAQKLFISRKTVETHRSRMMQKLDLHTTADLVKYSFRFGL